MLVDVQAVLAWKTQRDRRGENLAMTENANAALDARRRNAEAQAKLREYDLAKIEGETILVSEVMPIVRDELASVRARLLQVGNRVAPSIVDGMSIAEVEDMINDEIRDALTELTLDEQPLRRVA